jgi:hypothetical protein
LGLRQIRGDPNAELEVGNCRLIMFGRNDFKNMVLKRFDYPKELNGTMEIAFNLKNCDDVGKNISALRI